MTTEETFDRISHAIVCRPGKNFAEGPAPAVGIPDFDRAVAQHQKYCDALQKCGVSVSVLPADPQFPDACFTGDAAVMTEYLAVIGNLPDNDPRQGKQKAVASALAGDRFLKFVTAPGHLDCGDVLQLRGHFYITLSARTNQEGAAQLAFFLREHGHPVTMLAIEGGNQFRLSAAASYIGRDRLLIREELMHHFAFLEYEKISVPHNERSAAAAQMVNGTLILPAGCAATLAEIRLMGIPAMEVNISEFEKMGGTLAALSLCVPKRADRKVVELPLKRKTAA